jgi:hypothetical protein
MERYRESYESSEGKYGLLQFLLCGILLLASWLWKFVRRFAWWMALSPFAQHLMEGLCLVAVGAVFLWVGIKGRAWRRGLWEAKSS